jgi:hypothetical protein
MSRLAFYSLSHFTYQRNVHLSPLEERRNREIHLQPMFKSQKLLGSFKGGNKKLGKKICCGLWTRR